MRLIWWNAKIYNHQTHRISKTADALAGRFEILAAGLPQDLAATEKSSALQRLVELRFARHRSEKQSHK
jgi:hypothetical protein